MSTVDLILTPQPDGSIHLPLPPELRSATIHVRAELEPVEQTPEPITPGLWENIPGTFWMAPDFDGPLEDFKDYMP